MQNVFICWSNSSRKVRVMYTVCYMSLMIFFLFSHLVSSHTLPFNLCVRNILVCVCVQYNSQWHCECVCVCVYYTHCVRWHYSPTYKDVTRCMNNTWSKWFAINRFKCLGKWCTQMCAFLLFQRMCLYIYIYHVAEWQWHSSTLHAVHRLRKREREREKECVTRDECLQPSFICTYILHFTSLHYTTLPLSLCVYILPMWQRD